MNNFFVIFMILLVVAVVLLWPLFNSLRRVPAENGLKPIFEELCLIKYGRGAVYSGGNIPFNRVALYPEFMVISFFSTMVIPYKNIAEVSLERSLISMGSSVVRLKQHGAQSSYVLCLSDPKTFVSLVESHLAFHSRGTGYASPSI
jgi:hypothetical protein